MIHSPNLDMSFSGLKTSVLTAVRNAPNPEDEVFRADLARGFVDAVTDVLAAKLIRAMKQTKLKRVVVAGGVSANRQLRERLISEVKKRRGEIFFPPMRLCTDNGAMIAAAGLARFERMTPEALESLRGKAPSGQTPLAADRHGTPLTRRPSFTRKFGRFPFDLRRPDLKTTSCRRAGHRRLQTALPSSKHFRDVVAS